VKIGVINFSGNTGKSTLAMHLLKPRIADARLFAIESVNSGSDQAAIRLRGGQFDILQEGVLLSDAAIIDVGSSNVDDFIKQMAKAQGSQADFDYFIVPTMKEVKKQVDTLATLRSLRSIGVSAPRIRIVFNAVEPEDLELLEDVFETLFEAAASGQCVCSPRCAVYQNEVYEKLKADSRTVTEVVADKTDYRSLLSRTQNTAEREALVDRIVTQRLARSANDNLDAVFAALFD
jgi:hypothetical protein